MWVGSMAHALKSPSYEGYTAGRTLIQTIWDVMLYSQHFTFHWKLLGLVSSIEKSGTGDNNFGKCMERDISVRPTEMTRTVTVDHLQSWSLFRSDQTEMVRSIWVEVPTEITGILRWIGKRPTSDKRPQKFHTDDASLPRSEWCSRLVENLHHPIRSTTQIWVVTRHQYGISVTVSQTSSRGETTSGGRREMSAVFSGYSRLLRRET